MKKITAKEYLKIVRKLRLSTGSVHSAYDLNEVGGFACDRRIKSQLNR